MGNVIGFCGRNYSGKTELGKICEKYGYKRLYFALPLKNLVSSLLHMTIEEVNLLKKGGDGFEYCPSAEDCRFISENTDIEYDKVFNKLNGKKFFNTRDILQFIGTDLIRENNYNWHVDKIRGMLNHDDNFVIDDVRFQNEAEMLKEFNSTLWFVVRPTLQFVSSHPSETSLKWTDFLDVIINNGSKEELIERWTEFMENGYNNSYKKHHEILEDLYVNYEHCKHIDDFKKFFVYDYDINYNGKFLDDSNILKITESDNKSVRVYYNNGTNEIISNPLMIEDLKMFVDKIG